MKFSPFVLGLLAIAGLAVGGCAGASPANATGRFADEIAVFDREDAAAPVPPCRTLFVGGSSIALWDDLARDFAFPVVNRGFGGATIEDVNDWFDWVVTRARPARIVFYAGENDVDSGHAPAKVLGNFQAFLDRKDRALGAVPVWFVSIKPSPQRWSEFAQQGEVNRLVADLARRRSDLTYVEIVPPMLKDGQPRPELYRDDRLHMSRAGYAIWTREIDRALALRPLSAIPGCAAAAKP